MYRDRRARAAAGSLPQGRRVEDGQHRRDGGGAASLDAQLLHEGAGRQLAPALQLLRRLVGLLEEEQRRGPAVGGLLLEYGHVCGGGLRVDGEEVLARLVLCRDLSLAYDVCARLQRAQEGLCLGRGDGAVVPSVARHGDHLVDEGPGLCKWRVPVEEVTGEGLDRHLLDASGCLSGDEPLEQVGHRLACAEREAAKGVDCGEELLPLHDVALEEGVLPEGCAERIGDDRVDDEVVEAGAVEHVAEAGPRRGVRAPAVLHQLRDGRAQPRGHRRPHLVERDRLDHLLVGVELVLVGVLVGERLPHDDAE
mmetsp:Transcript_16655/g.65040  ORF Transcript_16655/g.65040 Transcript_16655/m.65040 type:complete len:309 (+) Transcript_16655:1353-2279(+)